MLATPISSCLLLGVVALAGCGNPARTASSYLSTDTLTPDNETVIFIGDTQRTSAWELWRERNGDTTVRLIEEVARRRPAAVVHLGDLVTRGSSSASWDWFDTVCRPLRDAAIPLFPVLGNHDYWGRNAAALRNAQARFPHLRDDNPAYGFSHRGAAFLMLDSNFTELTPTRRESQRRWLVDELARLDADPSIRWIVVTCHHPPFTNSRVVSPSDEVRREFADSFLRSVKGALFFSGHCHSYERFVEGGKTFVVAGGGGGPRQRLQVDPDRRTFDDRFNGPAVRFLHFCELTIRDEGLSVETVRLDVDGSFDRAERFAIP